MTDRLTLGTGLWYGLILLLYLFLLAPLIVVVIVSFNAERFLGFPPQQWSLTWYAALLGNGAFLNAIQVSLLLGLGTAMLALGLGVPAALAITRYRFPGREALSTFFTSPLMVPGIVIGLGLLIVLSPLKLVATVPGLLAAHLIVTLPYVIRTTATALSTLAPQYEEAALSLGARPWQVFWRVTFPLIRPGIVAGAALAFVVSFDELVITLFLVGPRLTTLPVAIYRYVEYRTDPQVAALSVVFIAISVSAVLLIERLAGLRRVLST